MCRVDSISVGTSDLRETLKLFLEHGQLRGPTASVVDFFIDATKVNAGLIELALQLLQLTINCCCLVFLKAVEKLQLGRGTRCDLFNLILAKNICTEYLIAIKRNRNGCSYFVQDLDRFVSATAGCVPHIRLRAEFDPELPVSKIRFDQSVDGPIPLRIRLWVWHESKAEAKKLKGGCLSSASASDQAVQAIGELQLRARQKPARHIKTQHHVVGRLVLILIRHNARLCRTDQTGKVLHWYCTFSPRDASVSQKFKTALTSDFIQAALSEPERSFRPAFSYWILQSPNGPHRAHLVSSTLRFPEILRRGAATNLSRDGTGQSH